jgi:hypothetical protein
MPIGAMDHDEAWRLDGTAAVIVGFMGGHPDSGGVILGAHRFPRIMSA